MTITLMDYADRKVTHDIGDIENIGTIDIEVITGDEIAVVTYKDGTIKRFDSSDSRIYDFYDNEYEIYNAETGVNYLNSDEFLKRESSYDYDPYFEDEDEEVE